MRVVDCWVNPNNAEFQPPFAPRAAERLMQRCPQLIDNVASAPDISSLLKTTQLAGVEKIVLTDPYGSDLLRADVEKGMAEAPDRVAGCAAVHPTNSADDKRRVRELKSKGYKAIKMLGVFSEIPYDDPRYFPIYAACEEEGLVATFTMGLPHIPLSNQLQHPLTLEPMLDQFPDLKVVMCHGGLPWAETCVALMRKWTNLYWMSSAIDQRIFPRALIDYALFDGGDRLMFATDFPAHAFGKSISDCPLLQDDVPLEVRENFAWRVAESLFFK